MVVTVHLGLLAEQRGDPAARTQRDVVDAEQAGPRPVGVVAGVLRQVLVQRAAQRAVEHLHPPAHRENRQPGRQGVGQQGELVLVAVGPQLLRGRVGSLAVPGRVDVGSAGEQHTVQPGHQLGEALPDRRQQHRDTARAGDRVGVLTRQQRRVQVPDAEAGAFQVGGDADQRPACLRVVRSHGCAPSR
jgi:hypothetical protein